ncbi:hypothetical protein BGX26_004437 [Mortierella sp. AD094]|nr:hypothetical protein BGX26_004437 [Mortierella sp. AD094]
MFVVCLFPNANAAIHREQGIPPDRADISVKGRGFELCFGKIVGPSRKKMTKIKWDLYRLTRFGRAMLDAGNPFAPLLHIAHRNEQYLRLIDKARGVFLLEKIGQSTIPTQTNEAAALAAIISTLIQAKVF